MELPNTRQRLEVISKLWRKTKRYLVIIEQGTNNGFKESYIFY
jgi:ribosomal protein RSM22 (predicted rRNA methylase)